MNTLQKTILVLSLLALAPLCLIAQSSKVVKEKRNLSGFSAINISGSWDALITQGENFSVTIEASKESIDDLLIEVKDGTLYVSNNSKRLRINIFNKRNDIRKVHITMPDLQKITASGGSDIIPQTPFRTDDMKIVMSGGSDLKSLALDCVSLDCKMNGGSDANIQLINGKSVKINNSGGSDLSLSVLSAELLDLQTSGGSDVKLEGETKNLIVKSSGGSDVSASKLKVKNCTASVSGAADVDIYVTDSLNASISGSSDVRCKGNPQKVVKTLSRGSSLKMI
ncbi:MAG: head GIN domain-containing protein [Candidatus Saccharimonadaceae bacterium]